MAQLALFAPSNQLKRDVPPWPLDRLSTVHDDYLKGRSRKGPLHMPKLLEAEITPILAERHRAFGNSDEARRLLAPAVEDWPAATRLVEIETDFAPNQPIVWSALRPPGVSPPRPEAAV